MLRTLGLDFVIFNFNGIAFVPQTQIFVCLQSISRELVYVDIR